LEKRAEKGRLRMLKIENLNVYYGVIHALKDISIEVQEGEIISLIGANGAGKSSTLRAISSLAEVRSGTITYKGEDITKKKAELIPSMGLVQVPEGRKIFANLTVFENLDAWCLHKKRQGEP